MYLKKTYYLSRQDKSFIVGFLNDKGLKIETISKENDVNIKIIYSYLNGFKALDGFFMSILNKYGLFFDFNALNIVVKN